VASLKSKRMELSLLASYVVGVLMSMVSSTNWLCEATGWSPWRGRPCREPFPMEAFIYCPRPSTVITKRKGERGSPCLMPHEGEKGWEGDPLTRMEKKVEVMRFMIQSI